MKTTLLPLKRSIIANLRFLAELFSITYKRFGLVVHSYVNQYGGEGIAISNIYLVLPDKHLRNRLTASKTV